MPFFGKCKRILCKGSTSKNDTPLQTFQSKHKRRLISAALDIGTTYSGYAYSVNGNNKEIFVNQNWVAGGRALISSKTPTCVLVKPTGEFHSFGYEAENKYSDLVEDENQDGWYFFKRFKMNLYKDKELRLSIMLEDVTGKRMPAIVIFSMAIRYLKDHLMKTLKHRITDITLKDITFVLTVPAIWNESAKVFMRKAAEMADIPNDQILIALEPECASIWCQSLYNQRCQSEKDVFVEMAAPGTKYMVVDVGGGTADITVHEIQDDNSLKEIKKASGGPWGGTEVDKAFIQLLSNIVTKDVMEAFTHDEIGDLIELCREFEVKKRSITYNMDGPVVVKVPASLKEKYSASGRTIEDIKIRYNGRVLWRGDKLKMDTDLLVRTFETPISNLVEHVLDIYQEDGMDGLKHIILVGGFAESPMLRQNFEDIFGHTRIMIPPDCGLAVLKGAVLFGHNPSVVTSRVARYTYGIETAVTFDPTIHPIQNMQHSTVGPVCRRGFWKAVEVGTSLPLGMEVKRQGNPVYNHQHEVCYGIYRSTKPNPVLVTDRGCEKIGEVYMKTDPARTAEENAFEEVFHFGETEIRFSIRHRLTGEEQEVTLHL